MPNQKREKKDGNVLAKGFLFVGCVIVGGVIGALSVSVIPEEAGLFEFVASLLVQLILLFLAFFIQLIFHEGGHLIAGLLTGYRFSSFRIGSWMILKNHGGYSLKRFSLAGTGGQCLLIPPEKNADGTYPYKLYHLGGVLCNLLTAALFGAVWHLNTSGLFFLSLAFFGVLCAVTNGIPMRVSGVATDGYNVLHIGKEPFALEAMWIQLKINEAQTEGVRLKDLPEEWFRIPENAAKNNEIIATIAVFAENRSMDALDFPKAKEQIVQLTEGGAYSMIGLYQTLLLFDKVTIDLMENGAEADISKLDSRQNQAFRKAMARYPAVIRTEYAIQLRKKKNPAAAEKYRALFEKVAQKYPVPSDLASEREIMAALDSVASSEE